MQTDLLFQGLPFSTAGSLVVALTMVFLIGPHSDQLLAWQWFAVMVLISIYRWLSHYYYSTATTETVFTRNGHLSFKIGAYAAAVAWGLSMWLLYPQGQPEYQILMILGLAGVAGGALAVLSYDARLIVFFQGILLLFIESRLLWEYQPFTLELAFLSLLYFAFLMKGGYEVGKNYEELVKLRYDSDHYNLALISTTEEMAQIGYWQWDMHSEQIVLSENLARMCHLEQHSAAMDQCLERVHADDRNRVQMAVDSVMQTGEDSTVEYRIQTGQDDWVIMNQIIKRIEDSQGEYMLLGTVQDISVIKSAEKKIFNMAYFDELTGLANRSHFHQHLDEQIKQAKRNNTRLAVLYIDLDGFKEINDTLGHDRGDEYLTVIAGKLKSLLRDTDFVARLGGDEFCIIMEDIDEGIDANIIAERCLALSEEYIFLDNQKFHPGMSIGIAIYPEDGLQGTALLKAADTAMYSAKRDGKHAYIFYNSQMTADSLARLKLESDLQKALLNDEFELWYQPKISLNSYCMTGVEALIRWRHPEMGLVFPDQFITTAERTGLINKIGEWVLTAACQQQQQWKAKNINLNMAINVSSGHFSSADFPAIVEREMQHYGLESGELEVEITESQTRNPEEHIRVCQSLKEKGIKVAIDDFGTGYSSLSVLKNLEINTLKVDKEFIHELPHEPAAALMVSTIVSMSLALGYNVVAEGVETLEQAEFLRELGCPLVQGYFFSKPVPASHIETLLNKDFRRT